MIGRSPGERITEARRGDSSDKECYNWGKRGHIKANCWQLRGKKEFANTKQWREYFISLRPCPGQQVTACNGGELQVEGIGDILVQGSARDTPKPLLIRNVLLAPGLTNNLLSVC